jgi:hypothetical protein
MSKSRAVATSAARSEPPWFRRTAAARRAVFSAARISSQPPLSELSAEPWDRCASLWKKHRRCVSRAPMKVRSRLASLSVVTRLRGPLRRGGRLLNHPVLKSTAFFSVSAARPIRLNFLPKTRSARDFLRRLCHTGNRLASPLRSGPIVWAAPARRAAFKPPCFEVNRVFQSLCSASHPTENSEEFRSARDFPRRLCNSGNRAGFPSSLGPF